MSTITTEQAIPTGTWTLDTVHSTRRLRGPAQRRLALQGDGLTRSTPSSSTARSAAAADVASITVRTRTSQGHLLSPDFFDVEQLPRVSFESTSIRRDGDELTVEGELEIRGVKQPVTLTGTIAGPVAGPAGEKIGLHARDRRSTARASG